MIFFILLTLGFVFELGKNALTIDSKQTLVYLNKDVEGPGIYLSYTYTNEDGTPLKYSLPLEWS